MFGIDIFTVDYSLGIVFDNEQEREKWLEMLLSCHLGGRSAEGRIPRPTYEHVFEVNVHDFKPNTAKSKSNSTSSSNATSSSSSTSKTPRGGGHEVNPFQSSGNYRVCVTPKEVQFFRVGTKEPVTYPILTIRGILCDKQNKRNIKIEVGRSTVTGSGIIEMKCPDEEISKNMHDTIYQAMNDTRHDVPRRGRNSRSRELPGSNASSVQSNSSLSSHRTRSGSMSSTVKSSSSSSSHVRQSSSTADDHSVNAIAASVASRKRTTSEGNTHFEPFGKPLPGVRRPPKVMSGSPLSPGSLISSESAGSTNSLDDTASTEDRTRIGMVTPSDDYNTPATILEESSAESCIEQTPNHRMATYEQPHIPIQSESRLAADKPPYSIAADPTASSSASNNKNNTVPANHHELTYASLMHHDMDNMESTTPTNVVNTGIPISSLSSSAASTATNDTLSQHMAASPPGSTVYSTILNHPVSEADVGGGGDYMVMSPSEAHGPSSSRTNNNSSESKISSSAFAPGGPHSKQQPSLLGLLEQAYGSIDNSSGVTSPNSQSSYNPLLDEAVDTTDSSAYHVMSPTTSSSGGGSRAGTGPRPKSSNNHHHRRTSSNSLVNNATASKTIPISTNSNNNNNPSEAPEQDDYVSMSPASATVASSASHHHQQRNSIGNVSESGVPIPSRNTASTPGLGTSPSAALTSHLTLFDQNHPPPPSSSSVTSVSTGKTPPSGPEDSPYLVMSPVEPEKHKHPEEDFAKRRATPPVKMRATSIDSNGGARPKTRGRYGGRGGQKSDSQRSSLCLDDHPEVAGSKHWGINPSSPPEMEEIDYAPIAFHGGSHQSNHVPADPMMTASGSCAVPLPAVSRLRVNDNDEQLLDDVDHHMESSHHESDGKTHHHFSMPSGRAYSVGCRPPGHGGSNSSVSTTGSTGNPNKRSAFINIPGATHSNNSGSVSHASSVSPGAALTSGLAAHNTSTGQSPSSTMASKIGSWFRHRAGSVPAKSAIVRRRHRTQSEGEKEDQGGGAQ